MHAQQNVPPAYFMLLVRTDPWENFWSGGSADSTKVTQQDLITTKTEGSMGSEPVKFRVNGIWISQIWNQQDLIHMKTGVNQWYQNIVTDQLTTQNHMKTTGF